MKSTRYQAKQPDAHGFIHYTDDEHAVWATLYERQIAAIQDKACPEFLHGLTLLNLPTSRIPQLAEVSAVLRQHTGWEVAAVPALIPFSEFFALLANKRFPAATFIRSLEDLDYLQEPDIFHEIFGHTPLLTHPWFAEFTHTYGRLGLAASKEERVYLARLYWFTVEFGLLQAANQPLQIYGGGILSSIGETTYAHAAVEPERTRFDLLTVLRTPYRIDILQPEYFYLEDLRELFDLAQSDLMAHVRHARELGLLPAKFPAKIGTAAPSRMSMMG
jgi:phenylalanine-4-hydroxylase